jgi:Ca-activated chloride channel family protein
MLKKEDFNDDNKDAGEIGAGHTVTALYEIVPPGKAAATGTVDPLKYRKPAATSEQAKSGEMLTLKIRYKEPDGDTSSLLEFPVVDTGATLDQASVDFRFAAAVAEFGMILRDSKFRGNATLEHARELALESLGEDPYGYRAEFIDLIGLAGRE